MQKLLLFIAMTYAAVSSEDSFIRMSGTDLLRNATYGDSGTNVLVLLYTSPVNSKESAKILETWRGLGKTLSGLITVAAVDCDEFTAECNWLGVQLCPHVVLLVGGEIDFYAGPMTAKSIFLFANNRISSPVAQIDRDLLDWWTSTQDESRYCAVLLQNEHALKIPWNFMTMSRDLAASHSLAEIRVVDQALKDRFKLKKLPSVLTFPCNNSHSEFVRVYDDEMSQETLSTFLMLQSRPAFQKKEKQRDRGIAGIDLLDKRSMQSVCPEMCLIVFIEAKESSRGEDLILQVKKSLNIIRSSRLSKSSGVPKVVWISTTSRLYSSLRSYISVVDIALWKIKRNRVAVFHGPSEAQYIAAFIDDAMSGSFKFFPLELTAHELVSDSGGGAKSSGMDDSEDVAESNGLYVTAGVMSWTCPSNILLERRSLRQQDHTVDKCFSGGRNSVNGQTEVGKMMGGRIEGVEGQAVRTESDGVFL